MRSDLGGLFPKNFSLTRCAVYAGFAYGSYKYTYDICIKAFYHGMKSTYDKRRAVAELPKKNGKPSDEKA